jgi:hypothetical protein
MLVVALSIVVGVLLTLLVGGAIYHSRSNAALASELSETKDLLKRNAMLLDNQQEQIAGLSRQIHALKDFAVAKASAVAAATTGEAPATK